MVGRRPGVRLARAPRGAARLAPRARAGRRGSRSSRRSLGLVRLAPVRGRGRARRDAASWLVRPARGDLERARSRRDPRGESSPTRRADHRALAGRAHGPGARGGAAAGAGRAGFGGGWQLRRWAKSRATGCELPAAPRRARAFDRRPRPGRTRHGALRAVPLRAAVGAARRLARGRPRERTRAPARGAGAAPAPARHGRALRRARGQPGALVARAARAARGGGAVGLGQRRRGSPVGRPGPRRAHRARARRGGLAGPRRSRQRPARRARVRRLDPGAYLVRARARPVVLECRREPANRRRRVPRRPSRFRAARRVPAQPLGVDGRHRNDASGLAERRDFLVPGAGGPVRGRGQPRGLPARAVRPRRRWTRAREGARAVRHARVPLATGRLVPRAVLARARGRRSVWPRRAAGAQRHTASGLPRHLWIAWAASGGADGARREPSPGPQPGARRGDRRAAARVAELSVPDPRDAQLRGAAFCHRLPRAVRGAVRRRHRAGACGPASGRGVLPAHARQHPRAVARERGSAAGPTDEAAAPSRDGGVRP